jgi:hypothetical protein
MGAEGFCVMEWAITGLEESAASLEADSLLNGDASG